MVTTSVAARRAPRWSHALLGAVCVVVGASLTTRPFTSLSVLALLAGAAALATGLTRWATARVTARRVDDVAALGWIVLGVVILAWPELSVRAIAVLVGAGMILGGAGDLVGGLRGSQDERLASVLKGAASVIFGLLALSWPDVTLLVVAIAFGARTVLFGLSELVTALRGTPRSSAAPGPGRVRRSIHVVGAAASLVVALLVGGVSAALHDSEATVDAFYDTPAAVPEAPGELLRAERTDRGIPAGATGHRILYTTTVADGRAAVASALVVRPAGSAGPLPVVAWAHGTTGLQRRCAPSVMETGLGAGAFFLLDDVLAKGWALVATDYVGLGAEGDHPYLVGDAEARSVLDAVRAARRLEELDLAEDVVVWGHSQGGGAALWAGQIARRYAPDLDVAGVAALAPASDLVAFISDLANIPGGSIFASYAVTGYASHYDDVRVEDYVEPSARTVVRETAGRCLGVEIVPSALAAVTAGMSAFSADLTSGPLGERLAENVPRGPFEMPLLVAQGEADPLILPALQDGYVRSLCRGGSTVEYRTYPGRDHVALVEASSPLVADLVAWTQQRLDGAPATGTCSP